MFEKNIFKDGIFPDNAKEMESDSSNKEQKENAYEFAQKIRKDMLERILEGKSPEEKEKLIKAMIANLQEDLANILRIEGKESKAA